MKRYTAVMIASTLILCFNSAKGQVPAGQESRAVQDGPSMYGPKEDRGESRFWSFDFVISTMFDDNIDHDDDDVNSLGLAFGMKMNYRNRASRPSFKLSYGVMSHYYNNTDRWDRVSHNLEASYEKRIGQRWSFVTAGEAIFKGSLEDRELGDQYILSQRAKYRISRNNRPNIYSAYRLKRYANERRNAVNPYMGAKFERGFGKRRTLEFGYRYEINHARDFNRRYRRSTYSAEYTTPLFDKDRLAVEFKYRPQVYDFLFRTDGKKVHRQDGRWILHVSWSVPLRHNVELTPAYKFEARASNYPRRDFDAHLAGLTLRYRW